MVLYTPYPSYQLWTITAYSLPPYNGARGRTDTTADKDRIKVLRAPYGLPPYNGARDAGAKGRLSRYIRIIHNIDGIVQYLTRIYTMKYFNVWHDRY